MPARVRGAQAGGKAGLQSLSHWRVCSGVRTQFSFSAKLEVFPGLQFWIKQNLLLSCPHRSQDRACFVLPEDVHQKQEFVWVPGAPRTDRKGLEAVDISLFVLFLERWAIAAQRLLGAGLVQGEAAAAGEQMLCVEGVQQ